MALQAATVEILVGGVWTNISSYVASSRDVVRITRGRQDEQAALEAAKAVFSLNNRDGRFSPRNPIGPYYGQIGRNTPVRISLPTYGYRFRGEVSEWPTTWDYSHQDVWAKVEGAGIVRRLSQGAPPLSGPIERYVGGRSDVVAYWPMTDQAGSTVIASGIPGGTPMVIEGNTTPVTLSANDDFPPSPGLPVMNKGSFRGVPNAYSGETYSTFLVSVPLSGDTDDSILWRALTTGSAYRWEIRYFNTGALSLRCWDNTGVNLMTSASIGAINGVPSIVRVLFYQSGGNVFWTLQVYKYADATSVFVSGSFAATTGVANQIQINADQALVSTAVGQLAMFTTDPAATVIAAYRGYAGETAGRRIERLCAAEGVSLTTVGDLDATELMGPQTAKSLLELLSECEAVDQGYLYEPRDAFGLAYRTRSSLYSSTPVATIPYASIKDLQPVEDDQRTRNDVTVNRDGGSSARSVLTSGALSIQAPPNGVGPYRDSVTVNAYTDSQLQYLADYLMGLGTIDEPRYPVLAVEILKALGALKTAVAAVDVGSLLSITGTPVWVPPGGISTLAIGYTETISPTEWRLDFNCIPGTPFDDILVLDSGRLDATTMVTNGTLTTTATSVPYTGEAAITTAANPADFPVDIVINGEAMRVTAATGTTLTVTRSLNGVVKTHAAGEAIRLVAPYVLAF
jgi:hypothetical protein